MKHIIIVIVAMGGLLWADDRSNDIVVNYKWEFLGTTFTSRISEKQLYGAPKWVASQNNPPLPVRRAIENAQQKLKDVVGKPDNFMFNRVSLFESRRDYWVYDVNYSIVKPGEWSSSPKNVSIFVLMDGQAMLSK